MKKKNIFIVFLLPLFIISACKKSEEILPNPVFSNMMNLIKASDNFTLLEAALKKTKLDTLIGNNTDKTLFAPSDLAFQSLDIDNDGIADANTTKVIDSLSNSKTILLANILKFHIIYGKQKAANIPTTYGNGIGTLLSANNLFVIKKTNGDIYINGFKLLNVDIPAANGVIHVTDKIFIPANDNELQIISNSLIHKRLLQAINKCNLQNTISNTNPLTIFAPNDIAFVQANFDSVKIANANTDTIVALTNILKHHLHLGRLFSSDFVAGPLLMNNNTNAILNLNGPTILGSSINTLFLPAIISSNNIQASNGVLHNLNKVIRP